MRTITGMLFAALALNNTGASFAGDLPGPVDAAITAAEPYEDFKTSFSMRASAPDVGSVVLRYDADSDSWSVIEGDLENLDEETREGIEELKADITEPGELTYATAREDFSITGLALETDTAFVYDIDVDDAEDPMPKAMKEALESRLHVSKGGGHIMLLSMRAKQPFKPVAIAKINTLIVEQEFSKLPGLDVAVLTRYFNKASGSAMFRKFDEEFTLEFFDYALPGQ